MICEVCDGASGGRYVGVGALSTGPMSVAFCNKCLQMRAEPTFALDYVWEDVAGRDMNNLNLQGLPNTWYNNGYLSFEAYIKARYERDDAPSRL